LAAVKPEDLVIAPGGTNDDVSVDVVGVWVCVYGVGHVAARGGLAPFFLPILVLTHQTTTHKQFTNEQELDYLEWLVRKYKRKGRLDEARELQADVRARQEYDVRAVTRLNEVFYQAFTKQDPKVMAELWLREPEVSCIHPGVAEVVVGYDRVMRVWKDILAPKRSWIKITPEDCRVVVRGNTAFAYCFERVVPDAAGSNLEQRLFATNVFVRRQGMWYIGHHHATLLKAPASDKPAQNQQQQNAALMQQLQQSLGLNGNKIINLGGLKGQNGAGGGGMGGSMGSLDDLAAQLGALERQLGAGEPRKPRVRMLKDGKYQILSEDDDEDDDDEDDEGVQRDKALTRKTVRAIQQLFNDGRITIEQKRRLLNEIIQHSNHEVPSMVEIAYELLLRNDDEVDTPNASGKSLPAGQKASPATTKSGAAAGAVSAAAAGVSAAATSREEDILNEFLEQCRIIAQAGEEDDE
jgi:ketosteroid isomerase-like protein